MCLFLTVSNVINRNYSKVSQKNIEKINEIIKKHRYVPNMSARSLTSKTSKIICVRYRGYVDALREANISLNEQYVFDIQPSYDMGLEVGRKITKNPNGVTAVVVTADILAAGIIEGLRLNGMIVPNDISVVGFDDLDICRLVSPKLTTISQDVSQKATKAVTLLMNYLQNNGDVDNHQITLDVELVDRQSVRKLDI